MKRDLEKYLIEWKADSCRRPLLIRGARQVGKSYVVTNFGKAMFDNIVVVDFNFNPSFISCFYSLDPLRINEQLSIATRQDIVPGRTLLFFDEIQECPQAVMALRYYHEMLPQMHCIGAGSLLEFAIVSQKIEIPVGRVQYVYLNPLSFGEFLDAMGESRLRRVLASPKQLSELTVTLHTHALSLVKTFMLTGGMPSVVVEYIRSKSIPKCQSVQAAILQTYRDDFGKYANLAKHKYLQKVFDAVPRMTGQKFKYSRVDDQAQSRDIKDALDLLERAGVIYRICRSAASHGPVSFLADDRYFKVLFLDVGLMQYACGLTQELASSGDLLDVYRGAVAEAFVGQELLACQDKFKKPELHYWAREEKNSSAEVDYIVQSGSEIIPVEVKSGTTGTLKSLHIFLSGSGISRGLKISQGSYMPGSPVTALPLYAVGLWRELVAVKDK
jgi:uncharacterized protein